jgi:hypothetical protein
VVRVSFLTLRVRQFSGLVVVGVAVMIVLAVQEAQVEVAREIIVLAQERLELL